MKKFFEDFKAFAMRGNVIDMAVGVIIGAAFGSITTSLVNDIFMPLIGVLTGGINFGGLFVALDGGRRRHDQLRPVYPERHQLHPDRVLHVPRHPHDEQDPQEAGSCPGQAQAHLPVLQGRDCRRRDPLPALHVDAGISKKRLRLQKIRGCQANKTDISRVKSSICARRFPKGDRKALWWGDGAKPHIQNASIFVS